MKLLHKPIYMLLIALFCLLILSMGRLFGQKESVRIAVIRAAESQPEFLAFQEGLYDGAQSQEIRLDMVDASQLHAADLSQLLQQQKKNGCDGVLLLPPEKYVTHSTEAYAEAVQDSRLEVCVLTYATDYLGGASVDGAAGLVDAAYRKWKASGSQAATVIADESDPIAVRLAAEWNQHVSEQALSKASGAGWSIQCGSMLQPEKAAASDSCMLLAPIQPDYTALAQQQADLLLTVNNYALAYHTIEHLSGRIHGTDVPLHEPDLLILTPETLFDSAQDALIFE